MTIKDIGYQLGIWKCDDAGGSMIRNADWATKMSDKEKNREKKRQIRMMYKTTKGIIRRSVKKGEICGSVISWGFSSVRRVGKIYRVYGINEIYG